MSSKDDASPKDVREPMNHESPTVAGGGSVPKVEGHEELMNSLWPVLMKEVESRMIHMEQEQIKRHNIKMMNEMQEVVRQIKLAKGKNDDLLKDYQKKQTDLTRSVLEIAEKFAAMRNELEDLKRQAVINKQQLTHRCDQTTEQVGQLKQAVFTAWQKEKAEIQQKVSQSFRGDLALVLGQFDAKLKESFADISKLHYEVRKLTARMNGEDPNSVQPEAPSYVDTAVAAVSSLPPVEASNGMTPTISSPSQLAAQQSAPVSDESSSTAPTTGMNMASLTQNLAAFIARQSAGGSPPQVNVAMLQQFMQTLPRQQQLQLQALLQQHRAAQQQQQPPSVPATAPTVLPGTSGSTGTATPPIPSVPPGLGIGASPQPAAASSPSPAATMIQSLAQQLQLQVNAAQQKASTSGPGTVNCPFFAMFGWCKFGDRCRYVHQPTGKEPLRNLPQSVIQTLQAQLASGSTADTTQTLMTALAGLAAKQQQNQQQASGATTASAQPAGLAPATGGSTANAVQQAMITAQIQAQQEAAAMGAAKAKLIPCRFFAIGRCAYGDRCAYSHGGKDSNSTVAAAAAAAWGQSDLQQQATWGAPMTSSGATGDEGESGLIMDGEDDTNYDQWNAMTFDDSAATGGAPPGL